MSAINLDVNNMIDEIYSIYSNSYKKLFKINPEKYIHVEDMIVDLSTLVPMWDSHANVTYKNTLQDNTEYRINSFGNAYVYVSKNAKIDSIYTIIKTLMNKGIKIITFNTNSFNYDMKNLNLLYKIVLPFVEDTQNLYIDNNIKKMFLYNKDTNEYEYSLYFNTEKKISKIDTKFEGMKINLLIKGDFVNNLYITLHKCSNMTIYSHAKPRQLLIFRYIELEINRSYNKKIIKNIPFTIASDDYESSKDIKLKYSDKLPRKYYPMV